MFCWATRVAVHLAWGALALAVFLPASRGLLLSRLIVTRAIPIVSQAFATVAFQRSLGGAAVVVTVIIVNTTTTMAPISAVNNVAALIVAKSEFASGGMAGLAAGGLADPSMELLQSFARETSADTFRLLAFECTLELFLFKKSLKNSRDGLDSLVIERFAA
jgi:hypothetical protein